MPRTPQAELGAAAWRLLRTGGTERDLAQIITAGRLLERLGLSSSDATDQAMGVIKAAADAMARAAEYRADQERRGAWVLAQLDADHRRSRTQAATAERAILVALVRRAIDVGTPISDKRHRVGDQWFPPGFTVSMSHRDLMMAAGIGSRRTVSARLTALQANGTIVRQMANRHAKADGRPWLADTYRVMVPEPAPPIGAVDVLVVHPQAPDCRLIWSTRGYGEVGRRVFEAVASAVEPLTARAVADCTNVAYSNVRRRLTQLQGQGLIERSPLGWTATGMKPEDAEIVDQLEGRAAWTAHVVRREQAQYLNECIDEDGAPRPPRKYADQRAALEAAQAPPEAPVTPSGSNPAQHQQHAHNQERSQCQERPAPSPSPWGSREVSDVASPGSEPAPSPHLVSA